MSDNEEIYDQNEKQDNKTFLEWTKRLPHLYSSMHSQVLEYSSSSVAWLYSRSALPYKRLVILSKKELHSKSSETSTISRITVLRSYNNTPENEDYLAKEEQRLEEEAEKITKRIEGEGVYVPNKNDIKQSLENKYLKFESKVDLDQGSVKLFAFPSRSSFQITKDSHRDLSEVNSLTIKNGIVDDSETYNYEMNENIIFALMNNSEVYVFLDNFDLSKRKDSPSKENTQNQSFVYLTKLVVPEIVNSNKYSVNSVSYEERLRKVILSGSNGLLYIFDLNNLSNKNVYSKSSRESYKIKVSDCFISEGFFENKVFPSEVISKAHRRSANYSVFSKQIPELVFSCGADRLISMNDLRTNKCELSFEAHNEDITCLDTNYFNQYSLLSSSFDKSVALWDLRNLKSKVHSFLFHEDEVAKIQFSNLVDNIFVSSGLDSKICIWDIERIGKGTDDVTLNIQGEENICEGPPELIFLHSGHNTIVNDFDLRKITQSNEESYEFEIASVGNGNLLQLWSPNGECI